jgi:hypothetical protein
MRERRRLSFAQPREHDAAALDHGVGALPDALAQPAARGLGRRLQALAGHVEQPAVEDAAQVAVLPASVSEVGLPVRAVAVEQAELLL